MISEIDIKDWINKAPTLDSAYERKAIVERIVNPTYAVFPENRNLPDWIKEWLRTLNS